jgi:hypothetical protein
LGHSNFVTLQGFFDGTQVTSDYNLDDYNCFDDDKAANLEVRGHIFSDKSACCGGQIPVGSFADFCYYLVSNKVKTY